MTTHAATAVSTNPRAISISKPLGAIGFALSTAMAAQVQVHVGDLVPFTLQTVPVALAAAALGSRWGGLSMLLYLAIGMVGFPVYADASGGMHVVFGATGGYLLGFLLCQPIVGAITRRRHPWSFALGALVAHAIIFALGVPWLKVVASLDWSVALGVGLWKFIPSMLLKVALVGLVGWTALRPAR